MIKKLFILIIILFLYGINGCSPIHPPTESNQRATSTAQPTYTIAPTYTFQPTYTPNPTYTPFIKVVTPTTNPSELVPEQREVDLKEEGPYCIGQIAYCSDEFTIKVQKGSLQFEPYIHGKPDNGRYMILFVEVVNMMGETIDLNIFVDHFFVIGEINGSKKIFDYDWFPAWHLNYETHGLYDEITSNQIDPIIPFKSILVFDVNPLCKNWELVFKPREIMSDPICEVTIELH